MRALVTGSAGLVGHAVRRRLEAAGVGVVPVDRDRWSFDGVEEVACDLGDRDAVDRLVAAERPSVIVHAGGVSGPMVAADDPVRIVDVNVGGTAAVLEAARRHGVARVVYCSSIAAYGSTAARRVGEETPLHPANVYAATKAAGEQLVEAYRHRYGIAGASLRLVAVFGPRRRTDCPIHDLLADEDVSDGDIVTVAGLVTSVQHRVAKQSGNPYGMITVEDFDGEVTVMFMGKTYTEFQSMLVADAILVVRGRVSRRDDGLNLHGQSAFTPDLGSTEASGPLVLLMPEHRATEATVGALSEVLARHPGETEVTLKLHRAGTAKVFEVPARVGVSVDLYGELKGLLGPSCLG